jgi:hypothetical protein
MTAPSSNRYHVLSLSKKRSAAASASASSNASSSAKQEEEDADAAAAAVTPVVTGNAKNAACTSVVLDGGERNLDATPFPQIRLVVNTPVLLLDWLAFPKLC